MPRSGAESAAEMREVTEMMIYQDFAGVYDELMDNTPYALWADRLELLIRRSEEHTSELQSPA